MLQCIVRFQQECCLVFYSRGMILIFSAGEDRYKTSSPLRFRSHGTGSNACSGGNIEIVSRLVAIGCRCRRLCVDIGQFRYGHESVWPVTSGGALCETPRPSGPPERCAVVELLCVPSLFPSFSMGIIVSHHSGTFGPWSSLGIGRFLPFL